MKLEFLDLTEDGKHPDTFPRKLVRLYSYTDAERINLKDAIRKNILNKNEPLFLNGLPYIEALNCEVTLILADVDDGLVIISPSKLVCRLTAPEYEDMIQRIELTTNGFNWLYGEGYEEIAFLISPGLGGW
jgi:hypothetical protein